MIHALFCYLIMESLGEHRLLGHGGPLYDHLLRIPIIIRFPPLGKGMIDSLSSLVDILPTLLDVAEISKELFLDGHTLLSGGHSYVLAEYEESSTDRKLKRLFPKSPILSCFPDKAYAIITPKYKYILSHTHKQIKEELYHLTKDPKETRNLICEKREIAEILREAISNKLMKDKRKRLKYIIRRIKLKER